MIKGEIKKRQSNYELLRMVAMLAIVFYHFCCHPRGYFTHSGLYIADTIDSFLLIHVTLFLLISGYFSIRLRWDNITKLLLRCIVFGVPLYLLGVRMGYVSFSYKELFFRFIPFVHNAWWFLGCYIQLMLLSPLLNHVAETVNQKHYKLFLILLSFMALGLGGVFHDAIDNNGMSLFHFSYIYLIGRYLRLYPIDIKRITRKKLFVIYLICSLLTLPIVIVSFYFTVPFQLYCSPFIIIGAVAIFLLFGTFNFENKWVDKLASSSLSVYMIHDDPFYSHVVLITFAGILYNWLGNGYFLVLPLCVVLVYLFGFLIDNLIATPIVKALFIVLNKFYQHILIPIKERFASKML